MTPAAVASGTETSKMEKTAFQRQLGPCGGVEGSWGCAAGRWSSPSPAEPGVLGVSAPGAGQHHSSRCNEREGNASAAQNIKYIYKI